MEDKLTSNAPLTAVRYCSVSMRDVVIIMLVSVFPLLQWVGNFTSLRYIGGGKRLF